MATTNTYTSPQLTGANYEDLDDIAYDISPTDTPFMTALKREKATGITHEWTTRALDAASAAGVVEGKVASETAATGTPVRLINSCQIQERVVTITNSQMAVNSVDGWGKADEETARKLKEIKRDVEARLLSNQPRVVGDAATARQTRSLIHFTPAAAAVGFTPATTELATDHSFTAAAGARITMDDVRTAMQQSWDNGADPRKLFCTSTNKVLISGFTGRVNEVVTGQQTKVTFNVTLLETDFGTLEVIPDRFFPSGATKNDFTILLDPEFAAIAWLRPFRKTEMGIVGDKKTWQLIGEWCFVDHNPLAHAVIGLDYV